MRGAKGPHGVHDINPERPPRWLQPCHAPEPDRDVQLAPDPRHVDLPLSEPQGAGASLEKVVYILMIIMVHTEQGNFAPLSLNSR